MRRRDFMTVLLLVATMGRAEAQQTAKVYRMAVVVPAMPVAELSEKTASYPAYRAFFEELPRLGYVEGRNLIIERFSGEGRAEYYPELARDVVRRNPDVIFAEGNQMLTVFKAATSTIPIAGLAVDPAGSGIVPSLARPGGNITGISPHFDISIWSKRVEFLKAVTSTASRVALLASRHAWGRGGTGGG